MRTGLHCGVRARDHSNPFLSGGGGLLAGALLGEAIEHHDEEERQEGFDQGQLNILLSHSLTLKLVSHLTGYVEGQDSDFGGGDFGGGGW